MPDWRDLGNIWKTFKELDVRPIQAEAEQPLTIAFVGADGVGKSTLIKALSTFARPREKLFSLAVECNLSDLRPAADADLIVLVLDAAQREFAAESYIYSELKNGGRNVLVLYNKMDTLTTAPGTDNSVAVTNLPWTSDRFAFGSAIDPALLENDFVPRVMEALPKQQLALSRRYPLFRYAVARKLTGDGAFANASYSLGTGLAEIIPVLDIPFNVADMVVLTKNQAIMVYKMGLALGLSPRWQDQLAQLGGVIGAGFLWRQLARQLVGLIPGWGILPKVAITYAGTFAVGEAVVYWYKTGHKLSREAMQRNYRDSLARGKSIAQNLLGRPPRLALPRGRDKKTCARCGAENPDGAKYCNNCGDAFA